MTAPMGSSAGINSLGLTVLISELDKTVTLNGTVETLIEAVAGAVFTSQLTYSALSVMTPRGSSTINGKLVISQTGGTDNVITLTTIDSSPLTQTGGGVTERLRKATIKFTDNQQGCDPAGAPIVNNNHYEIDTKTRGEVAASNLGFATVSVTNTLVGDSDSSDGGFPSGGSIRIEGGAGGAGSTFMIITANGNGTANLKINSNDANSCNPTWIQLFDGNTLPAGC